MQDTVFIHDLEVRAIIGIEEWERTKPQVILIDVEMACDAAAAAENDDIEKAVNYRSVAKAVEKLTVDGAFLLVETLAERIASMVRSDFGVPWVRVRARKPGAVRFSREVGIEVVRGARA